MGGVEWRDVRKSHLTDSADGTSPKEAMLRLLQREENDLLGRQLKQMPATQDTGPTLITYLPLTTG